VPAPNRDRARKAGNPAAAFGFGRLDKPVVARGTKAATGMDECLDSVYSFMHILVHIRIGKFPVASFQFPATSIEKWQLVIFLFTAHCNWELAFSFTGNW